MNDRCAPRAAIFSDLAGGLTGELLSPNFGAAFLFERRHKRVESRPEIENHQIAINHRAASKTPNVLLLAEILLPQNVAAKVVGIQARRAVPGNDALAIAHGRGRAKWISVVCGLFFSVLDLMFPEQIARA